MISLPIIAVGLATLAQAVPNGIEYHKVGSAPLNVPAAASSWKDKIKHVVVLVEENRSFDTFAGGLSYNSKIDGLLHHNYCNSMNASDANEHADTCAGPLANDTAADDPNHTITGVNMQLYVALTTSMLLKLLMDSRFSTWHPTSEMEGNLAAQNMRGNKLQIKVIGNGLY